MVEVIALSSRARPPQGEPYLLIEWSAGEVSSFVREKGGLHYRVAQQKHRFWSTEAILLARRMRLEKIYYIGTPSEVAWPPVA